MSAILHLQGDACPSFSFVKFIIGQIFGKVFMEAFYRLKIVLEDLGQFVSLI